MAPSPTSMRTESLTDAPRQSRSHMKRCIAQYMEKGKWVLKLHHLMDELEKVIDNKSERDQFLGSDLGRILCYTQEAVVVPPHMVFAIRRSPGCWEFANLRSEDLAVEPINAADYLQYKETVHDEEWAKDENALEVDFRAFDFSTPHITLSSSVGNGVNFISKFLSSKLSSGHENAQPLVDFLVNLNCQGEDLMINDTLNNTSKLQSALIIAEASLSALPDDTLYQKFETRFKQWGFEKGWGDTAERVKETMRSLSELLQAPDPFNLEKFFRRTAMIFNIVIFSPHGYFGQSDVLGLPDTGGQVVYILDQVKAMEEELLLRSKQQGINVKPQILVVTRLLPDAQGTKCNQEVEPINGTKHCKIL